MIFKLSSRLLLGQVGGTFTVRYQLTSEACGLAHAEGFSGLAASNLGTGSDQISRGPLGDVSQSHWWGMKKDGEAE
jgi:hypothetical protein